MNSKNSKAENSGGASLTSKNENAETSPRLSKSSQTSYNLKSVLDPCIICECSFCNLRSHCLFLAMLELVVAIILGLTFVIGDDNFSYYSIYNLADSSSIDVIRVQYILLSVICAISICAGVCFLIAICGRFKHAAFAHAIVNGLLSLMCLTELLLTLHVLSKYNPTPRRPLCWLCFTWFMAALLFLMSALCSYGLFTQIRAGVDTLYPVAMTHKAQYSAPYRIVKAYPNTRPAQMHQLVVQPAPYAYSPFHNYVAPYPMHYGYGYGYGAGAGAGLLTGMALGSMYSPFGYGGGLGYGGLGYDSFDGGYIGDDVAIL